ncbi:MAG: cell division protein FtsL [Pararhizobium sp.]
MLRTFDIVLIGLMVTATALTYQMKHRTQVKLEAIAHLQAQIHLQKETIDLLKADWSVLTQPARLERLTEVYKDQLHLEPIRPQQIATLNDLPDYPTPENPPVPPVPPAAAPAVASTAPARPASPSVDMTATGSVVR